MKRSLYWFVFLVMTVFGGRGISAQDVLLAPPVNLQAVDHPWDHGDKVDLTWNLSADDPALVTSYLIYSSELPDGPFSFITIISSGDQSFTVEKLERGDNYFFKVVAVGTDGSESLPAVTTEAVVPTRQWFDGNRFSLAIIILIFCGSVYYWIRHARMGGELKIRKIAGLEAIEEAVGRATEMGRSCLFIVG
ncbi:MAG: fibronectin type III domain-containing protein, partial [Candidatus Marinimicrobia bacterium]|nr:fibronectin type III domain-containing protein [Candidatus Neomarinimicrobiota bacterium]